MKVTITYDDTLYQLVPREPTHEQCTAMEDAYYESGDAVKAYKAGLSAAPTPPAQPADSQPLTDEQCDSIYLALHGWTQDIDSYDFGLPMYSGGGMEAGREIIRKAAHGIKGES